MYWSHLYELYEALTQLSPNLGIGRFLSGRLFQKEIHQANTQVSIGYFLFTIIVRIFITKTVNTKFISEMGKEKELNKLKTLEEDVLQNFANKRTDQLKRFFVTLKSGQKVWTWKIEKSNSSEDDLSFRVSKQIFNSEPVKKKRSS